MIFTTLCLQKKKTILKSRSVIHYEIFTSTTKMYIYIHSNKYDTIMVPMNIFSMQKKCYLSPSYASKCLCHRFGFVILQKKKKSIIDMENSIISSKTLAWSSLFLKIKTISSAYLTIETLPRASRRRHRFAHKSKL